jgi:hypothetical protein
MPLYPHLTITVTIVDATGAEFTESAAVPASESGERLTTTIADLGELVISEYQGV